MCPDSEMREYLGAAEKCQIWPMILGLLTFGGKKSIEKRQFRGTPQGVDQLLHADQL